MAGIDGTIEGTHVMLPCVVASVATARTFVRRRLEVELQDRSLPVIDDVVLATSELVTNAIEHGTGADIGVTLDANSDRIELSVAAPSGGHPDAAATMPSAEARRGRGLAVVAAISDRLTFERSDGTNRVVCVFAVR